MSISKLDPTTQSFMSFSANAVESTEEQNHETMQAVTDQKLKPIPTGSKFLKLPQTMLAEIGSYLAGANSVEFCRAIITKTTGSEFFLIFSRCALSPTRSLNSNGLEYKLGVADLHSMRHFGKELASKPGLLFTIGMPQKTDLSCENDAKIAILNEALHLENFELAATIYRSLPVESQQTLEEKQQRYQRRHINALERAQLPLEYTKIDPSIIQQDFTHLYNTDQHVLCSFLKDYMPYLVINSPRGEFSELEQSFFETFKPPHITFPTIKEYAWRGDFELARHLVNSTPHTFAGIIYEHDKRAMQNHIQFISEILDESTPEYSDTSMDQREIDLYGLQEDYKNSNCIQHLLRAETICSKMTNTGRKHSCLAKLGERYLFVFSDLESAERCLANIDPVSRHYAKLASDIEGYLEYTASENTSR